MGDFSSKITPVIGLELHIQLMTSRKVFGGERIEVGTTPNSAVSLFNYGVPGTLPRLDPEAVRAVLRLGAALGARLNHRSRFDRKHYHYPDLPKGYQVTQQDHPLFTGGDVPLGGEEGGEVALERIHLEEDAGRSYHENDKTAVDFNRAGIALAELVTKPEVGSAERAARLLYQLRRLVRELGISDGDMEKGSLRCDANISLSVDGHCGARVEVKNLNSVRGVRRALEYEIQRQTDRVHLGESVVRESRRWDEDARRTVPLRGKEEAADYRYLAEPDLPVLVVTKEEYEEIVSNLPELPVDREKRYALDWGLGWRDAARLLEQRELAGLLDAVVAAGGSTLSPRNVSNWLFGPYSEMRKEQDLSSTWPTNKLAGFLGFVERENLASPAARRLFEGLTEKPGDPAERMSELGLDREFGPDQTLGLALEVCAQHPEEVQRYQDGKKGLLQFFIGRCMASSRGAADPSELKQALLKVLGEK